MQATLLGLAIALILVLITALVGPHFVDWTQYRAVFETEASRLVGLPVRVSGPIDARILPSPSVTLREVAVGAPDQAALQAKALDIEFGLGPLIRGELRAVEMRVGGPQFTLGLCRNGAIDWPSAAGVFGATAISIDKLKVEDGRVVLTDAASGKRVTLDKFAFVGEVRSLAGPFKGEGTFAIGGDRYDYQFFTGRPDEEGRARLRLVVEPPDRPLTIVADGMLARERGAPHFDGALTIARPAAMQFPDGRKWAGEPWQASAKIKADPSAALMEQIEFRYGPEERAIKLAGTAEFRFGERPYFNSVMSARQIDFDRGVATADAARRPPVAAIKALADLFEHRFTPPVPIHLGIAVESMNVGAAALQAVRGDIGFDGTTWNLDGFEFRAPGLTQVHFSGQVTTGPDGPAFRGPVDIGTADPRALMAWLEGQRGTATGAMRALRARGDLTLGARTIAVEHLQATFDRETLQGRFAYDWPSSDRPARLDADLRAGELDIDALLAFAGSLANGTSIARPRDIKLELEIGRARFAQVRADRVSARLRFDAAGLQLDQLSVADLGGAGFAASGRIDMTASAPRGTVTLDLNAKQLDGVAAAIGKFTPQAEAPLRKIGERLTPAQLHLVLNVDRKTDGPDTATVAQLSADGTSAGARISLKAEAIGDMNAAANAKLRLNGRLETEEAKALVALLGLGHVLTVGAGAGRLDLAASGPLDGALALDSRLAAAGLDAGATGTLKLFDQQGVTGALKLAVTEADVQSLRPPTQAQSGDILPLTLTAKIALVGKKVSFEELAGRIADASFDGRIVINADTPALIDGRVAVDQFDAGAIIAAAIGMPPQEERADGATAIAWSPAPFAEGLFADVGGRVDFSAKRAAMPRLPAVTELHGAIRFGRSELAIEHVSGKLAGGRIAGAMTARRAGNRLTTQMRVELGDVDAATILPARAAAVISGKLALRLEMEGAGGSPKALIGSLAGTGTLTLADGQVAGIDPAIFDEVTKAVDRGLAIEPAKIRTVVIAVFDKSRLRVKQMDGTITIGAGRARLDVAGLPMGPSELTIAGRSDLTVGGLDMRVTLSGPKSSQAGITGRPEIFIDISGAPDDPQRRIDVSALSGWLTLRAVDQQARQLQSIEADRRTPAAESAPQATKPIVHHAPDAAAGEARPPRAPPPASAAIDRSQLEVLKPEAPVAPPARAMPAVRQAPPLPAPIDITPPPGAGQRPTLIPDRAENIGSVPGAPPRTPTSPANRGLSIDELLLRPQN